MSERSEKGARGRKRRSHKVQHPSRKLVKCSSRMEAHFDNWEHGQFTITAVDGKAIKYIEMKGEGLDMYGS